jgi:tetratricopeptide (TPR) repeat protein
MVLSFFSCCLLLQALTPEIIEHAQAGAAAQKEGKWDVAIGEFRKVIELQPDSVSGHANLGESYFQGGDYGAAIPELERALQLNPNLMGTHQTLGVALLVQGSPEAALPHLEKTRTPELLGVAYLETERFGSAIMALQTALERQPGDPDMLYYLGRATALASKRSLDQLTKINPELARNGLSSDAESRLPQDVGELQKALAKKPEDPELLAAFSRSAGRASKQTFDLLLQSKPNSARAHQVLAERAAEGGRLREAAKEYAEALRIAPYAANVHLAFGDLLVALRDRPAAAVQYRMETQLRPLSAGGFYRLGSLLLQQGDLEVALEDLTCADILRPNSPQILQELGRAAFAANDIARAEASWVKLLDIEKTGALAATAHFELAMLYRRAGRPKEADRETAAYEQLKKQGGR